MKKIIFVFFTFSGIYTGFAQNRACFIDSGTAKQSHPLRTEPVKMETAVVKAKSTIRVFPNPAKNKIEIEIKGFVPGYVLVQLINISGKKVREENRLVISGNENIVFMFSEQPGMYVIILKQGDKKVKANLLIQ